MAHTNVETTPESYLILDLHDPGIMEYRVLYASEPGYWEITDEETENLREYFSRGGFVIFDDFRGVPEWNNLTTSMKRVFPDQNFQELTLEHPVFHSFYDIETLDMIPPYTVPGKPTFYGMFDEEGQLQAVACHNNDLGDYWESPDNYSQILLGSPPLELRPSDEAFKFGVNLVVYALKK